MVEIICGCSALIFAITLFLIVRPVRTQRVSVVRSALSNPIWPRTKISFFWDAYKFYYEVKGLDLILISNLVALAMGFTSLLITVILAIRSNLV